ncbi:MAG: aldehyde dehydrogenase family protein, partial [Ilumatobacteraceae bacterium]
MADTITVRSPYDDSVIGEIPAQTADDVAAAVASAKAALKSPLPLWKRAAILDKAAQLLAERREHFALIIAKEAAKPIKTARAEAERAVGTFQFAAAEARKLSGEMVPL